MSSHSRLGAQQVLVLLPAASHGSHNVLVRGRARSQGLGELWETGRFAKGITTKHVPSRVCARHAAKQVEIGRLEDGFPQRLKENGLLLQLGDEALLEKTQGWSVGKGFPFTGAASVGGQEPGLSSPALCCYFCALRELLRTCKIHLTVIAPLAFSNTIF